MVEFTAVVEEAYIVRTMTGLDMIALDLDSRFELLGINTDNTLKIQGSSSALKLTHQMIFGLLWIVQRYQGWENID